MTLRNAMVWLGGAALLTATLVDTASAVGRTVGLPVRGAIELVQAAVLVSGALALLFATAADSHARVHILLDRMPAAARAHLHRLSDLLMLLFVGAMLAGSVWLAADLWNAHEVSELLFVPWRLLRLFANLCLVAILLLLCLRIVRRRP